MKMLHDKATEESVDVLRKLVVLLWFFKVLFDPIAELHFLQKGYFTGIGLLQMVPVHLQKGLLSFEFLLSLKCFLLISLALGLWRQHFALAGTISCVLLTVYQSVIRGFGYINHGELSLLYVMYLLVGYGVLESKRNKGDAHKQNRNPPFELLSVSCVIALLYSFVGVHRLLSSGVSLFDANNMLFWVTENYHRYYDVGYVYDLSVVHQPLVSRSLSIGFVVITFLEILAPIALVSKYFRYIFVAGMLVFHVLTAVTMKIVFLDNMLLLILFIDFSHIFAARKIIDNKHPVIFFDGVCNLCNQFVDWMIGLDPKSIYKFSSLQGEKAKEVLGTLPQDEKSWSVVLFDDGKTYYQSEAVLRIIHGLGGVYTFAAVLRMFPRALRDWVYHMVAKYRYKIFGKKNTCRLPTQAERSRFLP